MSDQVEILSPEASAKFWSQWQNRQAQKAASRIDSTYRDEAKRRRDYETKPREYHFRFNRSTNVNDWTTA